MQTLADCLATTPLSTAPRLRHGYGPAYHMTVLTTRVLDTSTGRPAGGVPVSLQREVSDGEWTEIGQAITAVTGARTG